MSIEKTPVCTQHGWCVEFYDLETGQCATWYGPRDDCYRWANSEQVPDGLVWVETTWKAEQDAATATGMYDLDEG